MGLLNVPADVSRVHACRRVFQHLSDTNNDLAIIHDVALAGVAEVCSMLPLRDTRIVHW